MTAKREFPRLIDALEALYGAPEPPPTRDPFELVLWENVAYLAGDERREQAFRALKTRVGTQPQMILAASPELLQEIAASGGGILAEKQAGKLERCAEIAMEELDGDVSRIATLPRASALKLLMKFPSIGRPGAEKILMLSGLQPVLALDSNGLRVLLRLGYGSEQKSY